MSKSDSIKLNLYRGRVIDLDDPDKKGKVQVKLLPEMIDIQDDKCPWMQSFMGNSSENEVQNKPPQVGSLIWVLADDLFYHRYYLPFKYDIPGKFDYSKISNLLDGIDVDSEYKNISFELYEDGSLSFHNRIDGSHGFIHNTGSYTYFDKDGKLNVLSIDDLEVSAEGDTIITSLGNITATSDGDITVEAGGNLIANATGTIELNGNSKVFVTHAELDTALQAYKASVESSIIGTVNSGIPAHTHISSAPGTPSAPGVGSGVLVPTTLDISASATTTIKTDG